MKAWKLGAAVAATAMLAAASAQEVTVREGMATVTVEVKHYKVLPSRDVYRAAQAGAVADVRFTDTVSRRVPVSQVAGVVTVRNVPYRIAAAFSTGSGLTCLLPETSEQALRTFFGLSPYQRLTRAVVAQPMALLQGQQLTIEGTTVGQPGVDRYVLVDWLLLDDGARRPTQRQVRVFWPGQQELEVLTEPGTQSLTFPCSHVEGETAEVQVTIQELAPRALMQQLSRVAAMLESRQSLQKNYAVFPPGAAYRQAAQGEGTPVEFADNVARIFGQNLPAELQTAPAMRYGQMGRVPVAFAFTTEEGPTCLIPADRPVLMNGAAGLLSGERVRVQGTTIGRQGAYACVLVDYLGFPQQEEAAGRQPWFVTVQWPGQPPRAFWDYGVYPLYGLPCQHEEGRLEGFQVQLREVRVIQVPLPTPPEQEEAEAPAPQPEAQEEAAPEQAEQPAAPEPAAEPRKAPQEGE